ncbi:AAA family ATPase [Microvirga sesbaniae]|uniref:AAA family ATPase n=1 Tax=Microvirga sesbaniae TaxID=681392 RepID=UPI0021C99111|nr:AAA family ATPase [Microvirga sp. HBU67692]
MKIISLISQKGGTGKTTTATGLAVAAVAAGYSTAIIDIDPQANATNWRDRREAGGDPAVFSTQPIRLPQQLEQCRAAGAEFVFIDTPGKSDSAAIAAAKVADLVLIPAHNQAFDIETLAAVREVLDLAGKPRAAVVMNGIHPSAKSPVEKVREWFGEDYGLAVAPAFLSHRAAYADAPTTGQAAQEIDPTGKAAQEIEALLAFVLDSTRANSRISTTNKKEAANG